MKKLVLLSLTLFSQVFGMVEELSEEGKKFKRGIYQHYKGDLYEVIGVGHHTETEEELVFYRALQGRHGFWARPLAMFAEEIEIKGVMKPRFIYIGEPGSINFSEKLYSEK